MNSQHLRPNHGSAPDALLDQVEQVLLAFTTAMLDEDDERPRRRVDEFAPEFLNFRSMPPG
jgi:hypothetical protein